MGKNALAELAAIVGSTTGSEQSDPEVVSEAKVKAVLETKDDKFAALKSVEKLLNKQFKTTNSLVRLNDKVNVDMPSICTNLPSLDYDGIQIGGLPRGRIIEIFGPESAGKTTVCLHVIAQEQENTNNLAAFVDAEHALDPTYASQLGVNMDELIISQPDSGEQALETVEALIDSGAVSLIVIDSVAALVPQAELDGEMGDSNMGLQARLMSQAMRKLRGKADSKNVTLIFVNQLREKIGVMFGSPETTTGGKALKFYASVRLDIRRRDAIKSGDLQIGHKIEIKIVKNKVGAPFRNVSVDLIYGKGLDKEADLISYSVKLGIIEKAGAWYSYKGERLGQGLTNTVEAVRLNTDLYKKVAKELNETIQKMRKVENE